MMHRCPSGLVPLVLGAAGALGTTLVGFLASSPSGLRLALAAGLCFPFFVLAMTSPRNVLYGLVVWLAVLGLVRRLTSQLSPKEAWGDPLLLVGAVAWAALAIVAVRSGAFTRRSRLTNAVCVLWLLLALSALNPAQGALPVALGGVLLVVIPMSSFFVGRVLIDDRTLGRLLWLIAGVGVPVALYGLFQTLAHFPPWDAAWIRNEGDPSLHVRGAIRAFSSFSAASEYAAFLAIAIVIWVALIRHFVWWPILAGAVTLLATALWYESSRGVVVTTVAALALVASAKAGQSLGRSLLLGTAIVAALPSIVGYLAPSRFSDDNRGDLARHQAEGLSDPFGENSTLPAHIELTRIGIARSFQEPVGVGLGATTIAGAKYGGAAVGTEADPGNVAGAAGLFGLVAYVSVVFVGFASVYRLAAKRRDTLSLAALGIVAVTFLQWINGGHYAVMFLPWLVLGWADVASPTVRRAIASTPATTTA